ncbi:HDOD domain-containing protein [Psychrobium sp. 1_MG-2023]|uniref:HDOD domain-containing protein n=1 Tax=Psychrobium sp. 1_MG-2023 TaxID=3062624 RepID=UPI000C33EF58|nr:HDOD domain-containing protein [Psychrobium sp. 1_MG-2023]MDP2559899.1 HDOD domain-containing protein [Psychrobium sp. 1_MG-2023]PKF59000.1 hypothetical protein CW748_02085 [Alteromonadales bacterium alter-6D02]
MSIDTDFWVNKLSQQELPALASTVKNLALLSEDDLTSLSDIGRSVTHDSALTSCILRVANRPGRSHVQVTTVSRACVVLGFKRLRNVCLTSTLLSGLLKSKKLSKPVYFQLIKLMSKSFYAAMISKMMMSAYDEDTQEEIFIATLLYHLGESAFWSIGGKVTEQLEHRLRHTTDTEAREKVAEQYLGASFEAINRGLVKAWNLSEVLVKAHDNPNSRTPELQVIKIADRLSDCLLESQSLPSVKNKLLQKVSQYMQLDVPSVVRRVNRCNEQTISMLEALGIDVLKQFLPTQPVIYIPLNEPSERGGVSVHHNSCEQLKQQLNFLQQLTHLASEGIGLNQYLETVVQGLESVLNVDRALVLMFERDGARVVSRFANPSCDLASQQQFKFSCRAQNDLFITIGQECDPVWVREQVGEKYKRLLSKELQAVTSDKGFFIAPLLTNNKCIGFVFVDRRQSNKGFVSHEFDTFSHVIKLMNLSLYQVLN